MQKSSPHYNKGRLAVAFVFSAPGARELADEKPIAGEAGKNLDFALEYLHAVRPSEFESTDRYDYRITNAFAKPLARSIGNGTSEAKPTQVLEPGNVARVLKELRGCRLVVLCGRRAQLLSQAISQSGRKVLHACHIGNRALITTYKGAKGTAAASPRERRQLRAKLWAKELLRSFASD
jgi:hypothetical protein